MCQYRFREFRFQEAEGPQEAYTQLSELCHKWIQPESKSAALIADMLIIEQFLEILPHDVQTWVRRNRPDTGSKAVSLAEYFLAIKEHAQCSTLGLESPYTNGAYGAPGAAPHYANLPQSNTYYSSGHPRASYPAESLSMYRPPSPASHWHYPPPDCPPEGPSLRRQAPGYSPPLTPGMPVPHYPYGGDTNPGIPQQGPPPQPRPQDESWASSGIYGMQPRYAWPAASTPQGSSFISESSPSWSGNGAPSPHPPAHDTKDATYDKPDQGANHNNYFPEVNQQPSGTMNDHKSTQFNTKPSHFNSKVQYCAQPQMYNNVPRKPPLNQDAGFKPSDQPLSNSLGIQPGIQRVMQVMEEVEQLEQEVDEFVGKKTDKAYRLLEEMLTKELLELDSIETHGQDNVRQARKEAVHRIQAILEKLEKKGL
ncbi:BAG family molecular chaperone regulator 4 isoform X4 [Mauremys reevesii]|uniref:BAG family molecular chaperone regulator 4 isoform X4 n=1 Tax=Mauremys reevesii TaxID=260615 RepID=UPI0019400D8F|nr:BAG family molecular chaperone regulator 4 isoform X4 [Mauremys reevesii]